MNNFNKINIDNSWKKSLSKFINFNDIKSILTFISNEKKAGKEIYPNEDLIFNAFNLCKLSNTKVVIFGQDPYPKKDQANGLAFSSKSSIKTPKSLANIFKEIESDIGVKNIIPDLTYWASQGVLLLNKSLTVESGKPQSHSNIGWDILTESTLRLLKEKKKNIVYLLWGNEAKKFKNLIDCKNNLVLHTSHPSPLSSYRGFFGCKHFSTTNRYLLSNNLKEIDWSTK